MLANEPQVNTPKGITKRAAGQRAKNKRPDGWTEPGRVSTLITSGMLGPDKVVRLARLYINSNGLEDKEAVSNREQRGWTIVTPQDLADAGIELPSGYLKNGTYQTAGCVLMKNSAEFAKADSDFWEQRALGVSDDAINQVFEEEAEDRRSNAPIQRYVERATLKSLRGRKPDF